MIKKLLCFVLCFVLAIPFVNVFALDSTDNVQKAYIEFLLEDVTTENNVVLQFNATSKSQQKLNVYALSDTFTENDITWDNAPNNNLRDYNVNATLIGTIEVNGSNTYSIDVTDCVTSYKTNGNEKITFVLTPDSTNTDEVTIDSKELTTKTVYAPDFDTMAADAYVAGSDTQVQYNAENEYMYYVGGNNSLQIKEVSSEYNYPSSESGKSLKIGKKLSNTDLGRLKFVNSLVRSAGEMVANTEYSISFKIRYASDADLGTDADTGATLTQTTNKITAVGINTSSGTTTIGSALTVSKNDWTEYNLSYKMTDTAKSMFGFVQASGDGNTFYVDDLVITKKVGSTNIAPRLTFGDSVIVANADTTIKNLSDRDTNFGAETELLAVYGESEKQSEYRIVEESTQGELAAEKSITYSRKIKNNTGLLSNVSVILAVYDKDNKLLTTKMDTKDIASGIAETLTITIETLPKDVAEGSYVKVFTWNNQIMPIFESAEIFFLN